MRSWHRPVGFAVSALVLIAGVSIGAAVYGAAERAGKLGIDLGVTRELAGRWLETGTMYLPYQLSGPYPATGWPSIDVIPGLYPPNAVFLFVPFLWLPAILWWAVPLGLLTLIVYRWRPAPWTWPVMAAAFLFPATWATLWVGNSTMWLAAMVAGGLRYGWPGVMVLLKPSLAPFALVGVRRRSWWVALAAWCLVSLVMVGAWIDYAAAMKNLQADLAYSLASLPMLLVPVVAWLGRTRAAGSAVASTARWSRVSLPAFARAQSAPVSSPSGSSASAAELMQ